MNNKDNLIKTSSSTEKNQNLREDLEIALSAIKEYEAIIEQLRQENRTQLKEFAHDLANPLQILAMTVESLEMRNSDQIDQATLNRIKNSTNRMSEIVMAARKLYRNTQALSTNKDV